jgi:hypothetical protein
MLQNVGKDLRIKETETLEGIDGMIILKGNLKK